MLVLKYARIGNSEVLHQLEFETMDLQWKQHSPKQAKSLCMKENYVEVKQVFVVDKDL